MRSMSEGNVVTDDGLVFAVVEAVLVRSGEAGYALPHARVLGLSLGGGRD